MDNFFIKKNDDIPKLIKKLKSQNLIEDYIKEYSIINLSETIKIFEYIGELIIFTNSLSSTLNVSVPLKGVTKVDFPITLNRVEENSNLLLNESIDILNDIQIYLNSNSNEISNSNFIEKILYKKPIKFIKIFNLLILESNKLLDFLNGLFKIASDEISILVNDKNKKNYIEYLKQSHIKDNEDYSLLLEYESIITRKRKDLIFKNNIDSFKIENQIKEYQKKFKTLYKEINLRTLNFIDQYLSIPYYEEYDLILNSFMLSMKLILKIKLKFKLNQLFWLNQLNKSENINSNNNNNNSNKINEENKIIEELLFNKFDYNYLINYNLEIIDQNLKNEMKKISLDWLSIVYINYLSCNNLNSIKNYYNNDLLLLSNLNESNSLILSIRKEVSEKIEQLLFKQNELIDITI